ncbi:hypothetical protein PIROE2DRAFT_17515 [Piromyces sp. E2]|nr:hypothetical protein PIROE2DRAFT_17515 [Piromyces sp. E2]|eukprot:OUM57486.1 hypothetical protein PIROE2DRAFT_17515 [Piromyces sp. E2]
MDNNNNNKKKRKKKKEKNNTCYYSTWYCYPLLNHKIENTIYINDLCKRT